MPPFPCWADLPSDLLCVIGDSLDDLQCYTSARGVCTAWRCALAPPSLSPSLLIVDHGTCCVSLPTPQRSFGLKRIPLGGRCVGASDGWLAGEQDMLISLFHPVTGTHIALPRLPHPHGLVSKIVFAPSPSCPTADDFSAAAICDMDRLAYVTAGAGSWTVLDPVSPTREDQLADVVYHENGKIYCLTRNGEVRVLRPSPAGRPLALKPLLSDLPFDPATTFAPPYDRMYYFASPKNLVFCKGSLYQIWRNATCQVTVKLPGGGCRRVAENEVWVLRYYPRRNPCWDAVADLGGYSVFIGRNNSVALSAQGVPGLKANRVYWIGGRDRDPAMVFDMATGTSTLCLHGHAPQNTVCWYFLSDMVNKRGYHTRARARAERELDKSNNNGRGGRVYHTRARARAERDKILRSE